jgi:hypothetical protein
MRIGIPLIFVSFFFYHIDKLLSTKAPVGLYFVVNTLLFFYLIICPIVALINVVIEIRSAFKYFAEFRYKVLIAPIIYSSAFIIVFLGPLGLSSEIFESKVIYSGYIKGTSSQLTVKLRANGRLEINNSGMGMSNYSSGHWYRRGDTLFLRRDIPDSTQTLIRDTMIIKDGWLEPVGSYENLTLPSFRLTKRPE